MTTREDRQQNADFKKIEEWRAVGAFRVGMALHAVMVLFTGA